MLFAIDGIFWRCCWKDIDVNVFWRCSLKHKTSCKRIWSWEKFFMEIVIRSNLGSWKWWCAMSIRRSEVGGRGGGWGDEGGGEYIKGIWGGWKTPNNLCSNINIVCMFWRTSSKTSTSVFFQKHHNVKEKAQCFTWCFRF